MRIVSFSKLKSFYEKHPQAERSLRAWNKVALSAKWASLVEVRETFNSADLVGKLTVFNVGKNKYRLITLIDYQRKKVFIRHVLTHAEYDRGHWKNDPWNT